MYNNDFRPAKRAHSPDFEDTNFRGSYRGHPNYQFNKRHRGDSSNQILTIDEKITKLGDTGFRTSDIGLLAKEIDLDLATKVGEEDKISALTSKICKCIVAFPSRVATYATLIGLISVKHYNVSCQIINSLHASYPVYLESQRWNEALTIIHLLSSLVNCKVIRPSALLSQFELLLEITTEENIPQARSDYYVYTVLSSLPYVALELSTQSEQGTFDQMLSSIETYLAKRSKSHLDAIRVWLSSDSTLQMDYLESLWIQTKNFRANNWTETFLNRPYNDKEYKDIMASSLIPQNSPTIQIPAHSSDYIYPGPKIVFRLYDDDVTEYNRSIPGSDKIERFCIENHIRNMIDEIPSDSRDCARHLSHMYHHEQLPMKHILIETILGELFTLPQPKHPEILYHSLLYELSNRYPSSKNPDEFKFNYESILNEAVKVLYENMESMNVTCFNRLIEWFSFHLNNTDFIFPWQSWTDATCKDPSSPKAVFVREILERCIRLTFHKKISVMVNEYLANLLPPEAVVQYRPVYSDNPKTEELAATVKKLIVEKADPATICTTLNISIKGVKLPEDFVLKEEKHSDKLLKIDIFTAVILSMASKSLTHLSSAIGKFRNVFLALMDSDDGQDQLLQTTHSCLETHPHLLIILIDKLLKAGLVDATNVCKWVFSKFMEPHRLKSYAWEILGGAIRRSSQALEKSLKDKKERDTKNDVKSEPEGDVDMSCANEDQALNEAIVAARSSYADLVLLALRSFVQLIDSYTKDNGIDSASPNDQWLKWMSGRMQQVYYSQYNLICREGIDLEALITSQPRLTNLIVSFNR